MRLISIHCVSYNTSLSHVGDDIKIGFAVLCNTSEIIFRLQGPANKWFGVVFGTEMFGDAIIYTTGKANDRSAILHDYYLSGKSASAVSYDSEQSLTQIEQTINADIIYLEYSRLLNTNDNHDKVFDSKDITFRYAFGNDLILSYHGSQSKSEQILTINLQTGDISKEKDIHSLIHIIHGIVMWIVWSVLVPISIFIARNKHFWNDIHNKQWFILH